MMMGKELCEQYTPMEKNVKAVRIRSDKRLTFMEKSYHFRIVKK